MRGVFLLTIVMVFLFTSHCPGRETAAVVVAGRYGTTYPISERDAYEEIMERVEKADLAGRFLLLKKHVMEHAAVNNQLGRATRDRVFRISIKFQLPFDIRDHTGKIIYPRGYTFNPLEYVSFPFTLVFFDSTSEKELEWLKKSGLLERHDTILITTRGSVFHASRLTGRVVYLGDERILKYFSVEKTPSIVYQDGETMILKEVGVYGNGSFTGASLNEKKRR